MRRVFATSGLSGKRLARDEHGTALIESAITMPFLLILGLGLAEFGSILYNYHLISTGVRDAARYLAHYSDPGPRVDDAKWLAVTGTTTGDGELRVKWWDFDDVTVDLSQVIPNDPDPVTGERPYRGDEEIQIVRVQTTIAYGDAEGLGVLGFLGLGNTITFTIAHEERGIPE